MGDFLLVHLNKYVISYCKAMMKLPREIQHLIAEFAVSPVYRLPSSIQYNILWDALAYNPHPGIVPLIDGYFERCLTLQSHLDWTMLHHLRFNPTAAPLLEKYQYFFIKYKIKDLVNYLDVRWQLHTPNPWNGHTPANWTVDASPDDFASHPQIVEYINNGNICVQKLSSVYKYALFQNPAIFEEDLELTQDARKKWVETVCMS